MSKKQYSESMKEVTGISDEDAKHISLIPSIIANSNDEGLRLLQIQFKVFTRYIKKHINEREKKNKSTS